jgi:hypothetical protein
VDSCRAAAASSGRNSSSTTSSLPWLMTSSMSRRSSALPCSAVVVGLLVAAWRHEVVSVGVEGALHTDESSASARHPHDAPNAIEWLGLGDQTLYG